MHDAITFVNLCDYPLVLNRQGRGSVLLSARPVDMRPVEIEERTITESSLGGIPLKKTRYILRNVPPPAEHVIYLIDHPGLNTSRPDERNDVVNINGAFSEDGPARVFNVTGFKVRSEKLFEEEKMLLKACASGDIGGVVALLRKGTNINVKKKGDITPLHDACSNLQHHVVKLLLDHGADLNVRDTIGRTPLHKLCLKSGARSDTVEILIEAGADVTVKDNTGLTPLHCVAIQKWGERFVPALISHGADVNAIRNGSGNSPLHMACIYGRTEVARLLIEAGAVVDMRNSDRRTPLFLACANGHTETVRLLSDAGASWMVTDGHGRIPVDYALAVVPVEATEGENVEQQTKLTKERKEQGKREILAFYDGKYPGMVVQRQAMAHRPNI